MSLVLQEITDLKNSVIEEYYFQVRQTEKYYQRDYDAALKIQTYYKMVIIRQKYLKRKAATIEIQRQIRGFLARQNYRRKVEFEVNRRNIAYFSGQATIIQRYFRGFYKRKYIHDFYARKNYLNLMKIKNQDFLQDLNKQQEQERQNEVKLADAVARQEFQELAKNLHHLSSTKMVPGVYSPPYQVDKPKAFDIPIESHLKNTFKSNYAWKAPNRSTINSFKIRPTKMQATAK